MNSSLTWLWLGALCCHASATTRYVDLNCPTPTAPYTNWGTAAATIQDAVDAAGINDLILVTNGVYASGGRGGYGKTTNRVVIAKSITVQSVNGPEQTIIQGYQVPGVTNGDSAIRCVYLAGSSAVLSGFTLRGGATRDYAAASYSEQEGGGVYAAAGEVTNCVIEGNSACYRGGGAFGAVFIDNSTFRQNSANFGGGAYGSYLESCRVTGNSAIDGGGVSGAYLHFCEVSGNTAVSGGGVSSGQSAGLSFSTVTGNSARIGGGVSGNVSIDNSIVYFNYGCGGAENYYGGTWDHSCTAPLPSAGVGNVAVDPQLASASHLSASSPCRAAGYYPFGMQFFDIDGEPWARPPSIGCDEYAVGSVTGKLDVAIGTVYTNVAVGFKVDFTARIEGRTSASVWDFGDGLVISNRPYASHAWTKPGNYMILLTAYNETHPEGVSCSLTVQVQTAPVHYVALGSTNPVSPFSTWETAADNIQSVVDATSFPGALVLVNDGLYEVGERAAYGLMTNRVVVDKPVTIQSLNGPAKTIIVGAPAPAGGCGDGAIRCVYLADGAVLSGFTLTNGATRTAGNGEYEDKGGAVWCSSLNAVVANCVLTGNLAYERGGAIYGGTLSGCTLANNNSAMDGGAAYGSSLTDCVLTGNHAGNRGGATCSSLLRGCTVTGNATGAFAGAVDLSTAENSIIYFNGTNSAGQPADWSLGTLNYCCTTSVGPLPGICNFTNEPIFVDWTNGNFHLQSNSPCINAGKNSSVSTTKDLEGNPRIVGGAVDLGAYEFQMPASQLSYAWLQSHGLTTDGSADFLDSDGDGFNNRQEYIAGTDPTNSGSALLLLSVSSASVGVAVTWQSVTNRYYSLQRSTEITNQARFSCVASDIAGGLGTTSFTDSNAPTTGSFFYKVGTGLR
jgi:predicted outer membrane repeat protein